MKRVIVALFVASSVSAMQVMAAGGKGGGMMDKGMMSDGMKGGGMMDMDRMRDHMKDMQRLMDRMHDTHDPDRRREMMREHHKLMDEAMQSMRHMRWEEGACPRDNTEQCMMQRQQMMQQRMDMMQEMMNQMMQRQSMMMDQEED